MQTPNIIHILIFSSQVKNQVKFIKSAEVKVIEIHTTQQASRGADCAQVYMSHAKT